MKRLQAAMRDVAAKRAIAGRYYYKVGSYFKGCLACGETEWVETKGGGEALRYVSGHQVFRSYCPAQMGWTYWCYECGAKDQQCWKDAADIGLDAVRGTRSAIGKIKYEMRKEKTAIGVRKPTISRDAQIADLEAKLTQLVELLKGGK
jgi:hypothetical protein